MKNKQLLIFDLDGTLIDSVPDLAYATNAVLSELGRATFDEDTVRHWVGNGAKKLVERALSGGDVLDPNLSEQTVQQALQRFFVHYAEHTCVNTQAYEGVSQGLQRLKQAGFTLALVTNKPAQFLPAIFTAMNWQNLFSLTLGGDSLPVKKPDPAPLLHVCEQLGFSTQQTYMVGDSKNDILAGHNANIDTLALTYGYNYGQDIRLENPTHTFENFTDLVDFVLTINQRY